MSRESILREMIVKSLDCDLDANFYNKVLVTEYPFLMPRRFDGTRYDTLASDPDIAQVEKEMYMEPYETTELMFWLDGWVRAFGFEFCEELRDQLLKDGRLDEFYFIQVKEKYGELRMYHNGCSDEAQAILDKYTELSRHICCVCGKPATKISKGWICPYCDEHIGNWEYWDIEKDGDPCA